MVGRFVRHEIETALQSMLKVQSHRGPDGEGLTTLRAGEYAVGMGARRLAVIDRSVFGRQPMANPDTGDVLVYNGEIYNCGELRTELETKGVMFRGRSDTEVLLRAYEHWGLQCLKRINGMFAFAVWDAARRRLVLARDHLGIKPLYYTVLPRKGLLFASEVKALLAGRPLEAAIDRRALAGYLAYGSVQEPLTMISGILALPPRSWLEVEATGRVLAQQEYWDIPSPEANQAGRPLAHLVEEGAALLRQAVHRQLISDVPLGVFLSSGLDSTAVLGMAKQVSSGPVHTVTVSFPDDQGSDEGPAARETAGRLGAVHHELPVNDVTVTKWVQDGLRSMDQPTMDGMNTYLVSKAMKEAGLTVALSGQGGDEVLGGYSSFRAVPRWLQWMKWISPIPSQGKNMLAGLATMFRNSVIRKKAQDLAATQPTVAGLYFQYRRLLADSDLRDLGFEASKLGLLSSWHLPHVRGDRYLIPHDPIASVARLETAYYLRNTLLRDSDVFGMANSIEIRVPYLEKIFVEWAFSLPGRVLLPPKALHKFLLRQMCAEFYSDTPLSQPKRGFTLPFATWLVGPLREVAEEGLRLVKQYEVMPSDGVGRLQRVFLRERRGAAWSRVWCLVALGYWLGALRRL